MALDPTGLYIHVPFCDGKCRYCAFYSVRHDPALARRWLAAVKAEFALYARVRGVPKIETVYMGGGTPTRLDPDLLEELAGWTASLLPAGGGAEWSVEANPGTADLDRLGRLARAGANRLSLGAQSFDDGRLALLGRRHTATEAAAAAAAARGAGFRNVGVDLIAGGPRCGRAGWRATLEQTLALEPEHVSVYALTVEEGTALARAVRLNRARVSDAATAARLHEARERLQEAGFQRYEISNYAKPGFACRHHLACWRGERYLGLGPAAASHVGLRRWANRADVGDYCTRLERGEPPAREEETLTPAVKAAERLVFGLRMAEGVDLEAVAREEGVPDLPREKATALQRLEERGWLRREGARLVLTPLGMDYADAAAVELI